MEAKGNGAEEGQSRLLQEPNAFTTNFPRSVKLGTELVAKAPHNTVRHAAINFNKCQRIVFPEAGVTAGGTQVDAAVTGATGRPSWCHEKSFKEECDDDCNDVDPHGAPIKLFPRPSPTYLQAARTPDNEDDVHVRDVPRVLHERSDRDNSGTWTYWR